MLKVIRFLVTAVLMGLTACTILKPAHQSEAGMLTAKHVKFTKPWPVEVDYLLFLPPAYGQNAQKRWPLILFLHGSGERGTNVWKVATHGPPKNVTNNSDFPFIVVSPQCREGVTWSKDALLALLEHVRSEYKVDAERIYLTGLSMGGYGTWDLGLSYPEKFAAIAPICGGGELIAPLLSNREKPRALKSLGIWAFHGAKDPVVSLEESQRMVETVRKLGAEDVKLTVYPNAEHDSWTRTYANPELYEWFLKHKRQGSKE